MKWWIWSLVVLALVWSPKAGVDVGKLQPVQVICLQEKDGQISIRTDVGAWGMGTDVRQALESLHEGADGVVALDTAEYLVVDTEASSLIMGLGEQLRPSCMVCAGDVDPETVGAYLETHTPKITMAKYRAGEQALQRLENRDGRLELVS